MMFKYVYIQVGKILLKLAPGGYKGKREGREPRCSTERAVVRALPLSSLSFVQCLFLPQFPSAAAAQGCNTVCFFSLWDSFLGQYWVQPWNRQPPSLGSVVRCACCWPLPPFAKFRSCCLLQVGLRHVFADRQGLVAWSSMTRHPDLWQVLPCWALL